MSSRSIFDAFASRRDLVVAAASLTLAGVGGSVLGGCQLMPASPATGQAASDGNADDRDGGADGIGDVGDGPGGGGNGGGI